MPKSDLFHQNVREALEKDGWTITHDPYTLTDQKSNLYIDLGAEKLVIAEKGSEKIAVEVKSFVANSLVNAFHEAIGQYINYLTLLKDQEKERILYLALPYDAWKLLSERTFVQKVIDNYQIRLIVFEPNQNQILEWKK